MTAPSISSRTLATTPVVQKFDPGTTVSTDLPPAKNHAPQQGMYTSVYTTDQGLLYSNGIAWVGLATAANTPFVPGPSVPAGC